MLGFQRRGSKPTFSTHPQGPNGGVLPLQAHSVDYLRGGLDEHRRRLRMVHEAERCLFVSTYYVEHDEHGHSFLRELCTAAQRGVYVVLVIDAFGDKLGRFSATPALRREQEDLLSQLRTDGAHVIITQPQGTLMRALGGGNHIKVQLADATEAIVGSSNVSGRSWRQWNERALLVKGSVVVSLRHWVCEVFGFSFPPEVVADLTPEQAEPQQTIELVWDDPTRGQPACWPLTNRVNQLTEHLLTALSQAQRCVSVTSFYFKPTAKLAAALKALSARGVSVTVLHSHRDALAESDLPWRGAATAYCSLLRHGVRIFESFRGEHSKILCIDEDWVAIGSYNFEHAAHDRLAEAMWCSRDKTLAKQVHDDIRTLCAGPETQEVTQATLAAMSWRDKISNILVRPVAQWL